ncbi:hypothetical protein [Natrinema thermotolerans]|uniref:hypothetical protein n=1 Tax=Natrinema thermotolerans TaxID=121872 RepID=UPI0006795AA8|nr:hypothetical protein [Natrinema thermotolerans]QCC57370.1 hypothetical protein DVR14_01430 [Natrinema thermotolerans]
MTDHVFPEDQGTNENLTDPGDGDANDAANWAGAHYSANDVDYVLSGLTFSADWATPALDISQGKARISSPEATGAQTGEIRRDVAFTVEVDARSGVALEADATNHVYLNVLLTDDDALEIVINTTGTVPAEPSLKIGVVDTAAETVDEVNRAPSAHFSEIVLEDTSTGS